MVSLQGREFSILTVCTGNICRSPAAERLLRSEFPPQSGITVASAGTHALVGESIQASMAELLRVERIDTSGFAARQLSERMVREADLILTMTRMHRGAVAILWPAAVRRTFTLLEFARLAEQVNQDELDSRAGMDATPAERFASLVPLATIYRAAVPPSLDDVIDPYREALQVYTRSFSQIREGIRPISRSVLGT